MTTCQHCSSGFTPLRPEYPSRFCSTRCRSANWRSENHEHFKQRLRDHYVRNRDRMRKDSQARRYGLTAAGVSQIREFQNDRCGSCGVSLDGEGSIEHDHATGRIRGLTCVSCNNMIGMHGDSIERLEARRAELQRLERLAGCVIAYLEDPPGPKALGV